MLSNHQKVVGHVPPGPTYGDTPANDYIITSNWSGLLVSFDYRVGGVPKDQNLNHVINKNLVKKRLFSFE